MNTEMLKKKLAQRKREQQIFHIPNPSSCLEEKYPHKSNKVFFTVVTAIAFVTILALVLSLIFI